MTVVGFGPSSDALRGSHQVLLDPGVHSLATGSRREVQASFKNHDMESRRRWTKAVNAGRLCHCGRGVRV